MSEDPKPPRVVDSGLIVAGSTGFDQAAIARQIADGTIITLGAKQEYIYGVNVAHLRNGLRDFRDAIVEREAWKAPAGVGLTLFSTVITLVAAGSDFKFLGFGREVWGTACGIALLGAAFSSLKRGWRARAHRGVNLTERLVNELKRREGE